MAQPFRNSISTYRLRKDRLEDYLKSQFSEYTKKHFNVHLSEDGKEFWIFYTPKALTTSQSSYIEDHVRLKPSHEEEDFL
ncbi:hypothetical protein B0T16DRAFT_455009 [Cercophora newfieldiana]|uniref:Uncharacterized protein n=1 Tax=Cercophora newfieldiana TaxID=92897 RepID=A0AA39YHD8_9PEZI|nr:hypothetical protein B0T16DRAFT_455009 [Cercophora newfieldiana]